MFKLAIRADGGPSIGMGHIMRCMNLAMELKRLGCEVYFISKYKEGIAKLTSSGFSVIQIEDFEINKNSNGFDYGDKENLELEANQIIDIVKKHSLDMIIIDSYNVDENYFLTIKKHVKKLCYIDDINKFDYPVDILINGNVTGDYYKYNKFDDNEIMLLGLKYNLIREEFRDLPQKKINKRVKKIMVTVGGADPLNLTEKLLDILVNQKNLSDVQINVIIGPAFNNKINIFKHFSHYSNINLLEDVNNMSQIMMEADIAISSGGSTLYELCACGTPTMAFILADNQKDIVDYLSKSNLLISIGWHYEITPDKFQSILEDLITDYTKRVNMSKNMQNLIDGYGARRAAAKLVESISM